MPPSAHFLFPLFPTWGVGRVGSLEQDQTPELYSLSLLLGFSFSFGSDRNFYFYFLISGGEG
jgi:hypothetical protein